MQHKKTWFIWGLLFGITAASANPHNPNVVAGSATFSSTSNLLEINNSPGTIINWQDFSIAANEITRFIQQSPVSAVLNRVSGASISQILGTLESNGQVFVINPNGLLIGKNAFIDTAGFVGSTLDIDDRSFVQGDYQFSGDSGVIENQGEIRVSGSGDIILLGTTVENSGILQTENGDIVLAAGRDIRLSYAGMDHIVFKIQAPTDTVINLGEIIAGKGNAALYGGQIQQQGSIELVETSSGRIFINAVADARISGSLVAPGGQIKVLGENISLTQASLSTSSANSGGEILIGGDYQGGNGVRTARTTVIDQQSTLAANSQSSGDGGRIIVWSDEYTRVAGNLGARAEGSTGDGGFIETSSAGQLEIDAIVSVSASNGDAGEWLLDPEDITINESMASSIEGTLNEGGDVTVKTSDQGDGDGNITVAAPITKTTGDDASLTLDAHNRIDVNAPIRSESNKLKVTLKAGKEVNVNSIISTNGGDIATIITGVVSNESANTTDTENSDGEESSAENPEEEIGEPLVVESDEESTEESSNDSTDTDDDAVILADDDANSNNENSNGDSTGSSDVQSTEIADTNDDESQGNIEESSVVDQNADVQVANEEVDTSDVANQETESESVDQVSDTGDSEVVDEVTDTSTADTSDIEVVSNSEVNDVATESDSASSDTADTLKVTISALLDTNGGDIEINAGNDAEVIIDAVLDASNEIENSIGGNVIVDTGSFVSRADIIASGDQLGGNITINAEQSVALGGDLIADGQTGGQIVISTGRLSLAETISAQGDKGDGGTVTLNVAQQTLETNSSTVNVSGRNGGSISHIAGEQITSSGTYLAIGNAGQGGDIDISAPATKLLSANIAASGETAGGQVRIGGEYQGGKSLATDELPNAILLAVNDGTQIRAEGLGEGSDGGTVVLWADDQAAVYGNISAAQNRESENIGAGGFVEISSGNTLTYAGDATAGLGGTVLFDPKNIIVDTTPLSSQYALILGFNYNSIVTTLGGSDLFGNAVSLNSAGDRLAVGAFRDDGFSNTVADAGAVYLFSFTDNNFSGGVLQSIIGKGYVGGNNFDVSNLGANDFFGQTVSLDGDGDSLAVGALRDDGFNNVNGINGNSFSGAAYLFKFSDNNFTNPNLEAIFGSGYSGTSSAGGDSAKNRSFGTGNQSQFASGVALNNAGDRLAVGSPGDFRFGTSNFYEGAVYLFTFSDEQFSDGTQVSKIADFSPAGSPVPGANDLNLTFLDPNDYLGTKLALNGVGDRLVVATPGDDGRGQADFFAGSSTGAIHMFSFSDGDFSNPTLEGTIGSGYTLGAKDFDPGDITISGIEFATAVSINDVGDRIAVSGDQDDGLGNAAANAGIIRIFDFSDNSFSAGSEERRIGFGYTGGNNIDVANLEAGDRATAVGLNGLGDKLAGGWFFDDGNLEAAPAAGAVYFFDLNLPGDTTADVADGVFATAPGSTITISPTKITDITNTGSAVVLQANNDISVFADIISNNPLGDGGDLTLQAGSRIIINADIDTDNGNFTAIANELIANGAVDSERDDLFADLIISGANINAGTGNVVLAVRDDPAKVNNLRGSIFLVGGAQITANDLTINEATNVLVGFAGTTLPATIDLSGNLNVDIDGRFDVVGGVNVNANANITVGGAANVSASLIRFTGDTGSSSFQADSINMDSDTNIIFSSAELTANQSIDLSSTSFQLSGDSGDGATSIRSMTGNINFGAGSNVAFHGATEVLADAGSIIVTADQNIEVDGSGEGSNTFSAANNIDFSAENGVIDIFGTIAPSAIPGISSITAGGNVSLFAGGDITAVGGGADTSGVVIDGANVTLNSGGFVALIGGGSATASVEVISDVQIDIDAVSGFSLFSGTDPAATASLNAGGDVNIDADLIEVLVDAAPTTVMANNIALNSLSTVVVQGAQITANQNILLDSLGNVDITGDSIVGMGLLQATFGTLDLNVGGSVNLIGAGQLVSGGDLSIDAVNDLNLLSGFGGVHSITSDGNLDVNVGGAIDIRGGSAAFPGLGSGMVEALGDANFTAAIGINLFGGDLANSGVQIEADNISFVSGTDILFQGGDANNTSVQVLGAGTVNFDSIGALTLMGGSAAGSDVLVFSNSLATINIDAESVDILANTGTALLNVVDGALGSTVNITTTIAGACTNCVQVGLLDQQGIVADVINYSTPLVMPPVEPPAIPEVAEEVVTPIPPVIEEVVLEIVTPEEPMIVIEIEQPVIEIPDDIINEVLVLSTQEDANELVATTANDSDNDDEEEEFETQCRV